ncbi:MAG: hypothetical protein OEY06_10855 [Gammaproteobacteria bacterium]|nr:hypothetical protein [Gammaproteobacteria bacterium]
MADNMGIEGMEIVLDAGPDVDDDSNQIPKRINFEYEQKTIKGINRSFTLFDDIYLKHSLEKNNPVAFKLKFFRDKNIGERTVNLTYMGVEPEKTQHVAWNWLYVSLAALAIAFILIYVGVYSGFSFAHAVMLPVAIVLICFGLIALMIFYYKTQHKIIYRSCFGQVPIIELFHMPGKKAYNDFIDVLEQSIDSAHRRQGVTMKYRLVGELKYLRKMSEAGFIAQSDYEKARGKIFKHKEYQV